jgi:hypothetical protein
MEVLVSQIPYGIEIMSLVVAIAGLVSAVVPDSKMPAIVSTVLNWLAMNWGHAANDETVN